MTDQPIPGNEPDWLDDFESMADDILDDGSACEQIHPIVARWFDKLMDGDPPASRDSVMQAMACLATEVLNNSPEEIFDKMITDENTEEEVSLWIEHILLVGRAFEIALRGGELDDL